MYITVGSLASFNFHENEIRCNFGAEITDGVKEIVERLVDDYGENRDIYNEDGGFVVLIKNREEYDEFDKTSFSLLSRNFYESYYCHKNGDTDYVEVLYLMNNETGVSVFMPKEFFEE